MKKEILFVLLNLSIGFFNLIGQDVSDYNKVVTQFQQNIKSIEQSKYLNLEANTTQNWFISDGIVPEEDKSTLEAYGVIKELNTYSSELYWMINNAGGQSKRKQEKEYKAISIKQFEYVDSLSNWIYNTNKDRFGNTIPDERLEDNIYFRIDGNLLPDDDSYVIIPTNVPINPKSPPSPPKDPKGTSKIIFEVPLENGEREYYYELPLPLESYKNLLKSK